MSFWSWLFKGKAATQGADWGTGLDALQNPPGGEPASADAPSDHGGDNGSADVADVADSSDFDFGGGD